MKLFQKYKYSMFIIQILHEAHYAEGTKVQTTNEIVPEYLFDSTSFLKSDNITM